MCLGMLADVLFSSIFTLAWLACCPFLLVRAFLFNVGLLCGVAVTESIRANTDKEVLWLWLYLKRAA
ncbi:MAG: hypothetical protein ACJA2A_002068 [Cycloclasticus pugetii]|jgi:hypothetical protein